jgi:hypothetical protein
MTPAAKRLRVQRVVRAMGERFVPYRMHHLVRITLSARREAEQRHAALRDAYNTLNERAITQALVNYTTENVQ